MTGLALKVTARSDETASVCRVDFAAVDGQPLPGFKAGAHIGLDLPGVGMRKYSLINADSSPDATRAPLAYRLGVRLEAHGGGGSRAIHALGVGDIVTADAPKNDFALRLADAPVVLLGGGIGVTPLITMAAELKATGRAFRLVYAVRSHADAAFLGELRDLVGADLSVHDDAASGHVLDIGGVFGALTADEPVYACGPKPMLKAAIMAARKRGWSVGRLSFELFYSTAATPAS